jgi:hypothetical protein
MPSYQVIQDPVVLKDFITNFLPDLEPDETYFVSLFARKKYNPSIMTDKSQLKSFTSTKERLFSKIMQLECPVGAYVQGEGEKQIAIPQDALAIYISPNPRSNTIAANKSLIKLAKIITNPNKKNYNLHKEILAEVQTSRSRSIFVDFDFDDVDFKEVVEKVEKVINRDAFHVLVTRGGFHLMVNPDKVIVTEIPGSKKKFNWYNEVKKIHMSDSSDIKNHGDNMIPIPGCVQGGFSPYIYKG